MKKVDWMRKWTLLRAILFWRRRIWRSRRNSIKLLKKKLMILRTYPELAPQTLKWFTTD
jgi:hypothetical protein